MQNTTNRVWNTFIQEMAEYQTLMGMDDKTKGRARKCVICGKWFKRKNRWVSQTCSIECKNKWSSLAHRKVKSHKPINSYWSKYMARSDRARDIINLDEVI